MALPSSGAAGLNRAIRMYMRSPSSSDITTAAGLGDVPVLELRILDVPGAAHGVAFFLEISTGPRARVAPGLDERRDRRLDALRQEAEGGVGIAAEIRARVEACFDGRKAQSQEFAGKGQERGEVALLGGGVRYEGRVRLAAGSGS